MRCTTIILALAMLTAAGCSGSGEPKILLGDAALAAGETSPQFLDGVSTQASVTENQAMRGLLLLLDDKDNCKDFAARVKVLTDRGLADRNWTFVADRAITKGKLAYMICQAAKVRGGLILTLTGPSQRYCLRELQYQGLMSAGVVNAKVTGMEFVAVMTRADTFIQTGEVGVVMATQARSE